MTYTDLIFWILLAVVALLQIPLRKSPRARNVYLLLVSLGFYFYSGGLTVAVLLLVTLSDFLLARGIASVRHGFVRRLALCSGLVLDLCLLCYFKYSGFLTDIINGMFSLDLRPAETFPFSSFVPLGISFFIFKNIGYLVDVFHGKVQPVRNLWDFAMFTTFFPTIMSGPILCADQFIPQIYRRYHVSRRALGIAVFWILNGMAKKVILGDWLAANFIDRVFDNARFFTGFESLCAAFGYSLQLYADFSGYTDIATGVALLLGFWIPRNFDSPYKSTDAQVFWKRWHISLSSWLQEYLYYPLGGNRRLSFATFAVLYGVVAVIYFITGSMAVIYAAAGLTLFTVLYSLLFKGRRKMVKGALNTMVTMLLGGLWHGASYTYVLWGGINGAGIIASRCWKDSGWIVRQIVSLAAIISGCYLKFVVGGPLVNLFFWIAAAFSVSTFIRSLYFLSGCEYEFRRLGSAWAVVQTFVFASFAWIFFRSSSLENALALLSQIGDPTQWDAAVIGDILASYWKVFAVMAGGLVIHWLPDRFKRRTRIRFASMPLMLMAAVVVAAVFIIVQFASAEPHPFIYFQF